jgi:hypothetical protein
LRRESVPGQGIVKRATELFEFGRRHAQWRFTIGPGFNLFG